MSRCTQTQHLPWLRNRLARLSLGIIAYLRLVRMTLWLCSNLSHTFTHSSIQTHTFTHTHTHTHTRAHTHTHPHSFSFSLHISSSSCKIHTLTHSHTPFSAPTFTP